MLSTCDSSEAFLLAAATGPDLDGSLGNKYLSQSPRLLNASPYNYIPIHILLLAFLFLTLLFIL